MTGIADDALPVVRADDIDDAQAGPRWLVQSLWARAGVGILGGPPIPDEEECASSSDGGTWIVATASGEQHGARVRPEAPWAIVLGGLVEAGLGVGARRQGARVIAAHPRAAAERERLTGYTTCTACPGFDDIPE